MEAVWHSKSNAGDIKLLRTRKALLSHAGRSKASSRAAARRAQDARAGPHRLAWLLNTDSLFRMTGRSVGAPDVRTRRCRAPRWQRYFYGSEFSQMDNNNRR